MPPKPLPTDIRSGPGRKPIGPFVVINPRKIPKGRFIIRETEAIPCDHEKDCGKSHGYKESGRWFEGDAYAGDKVEMWLGRGFIEKGSPKNKPGESE